MGFLLVDARVMGSDPNPWSIARPWRSDIKQSFLRCRFRDPRPALEHVCLKGDVGFEVRPVASLTYAPGPKAESAASSSPCRTIGSGKFARWYPKTLNGPTSGLRTTVLLGGR
jgi:hypothetical protein